MQLDELLAPVIEPWIKDLESAFQPYPEFVQVVVQKLKEIEATLSSDENSEGEAKSSSLKVSEAPSLTLTDKRVLLVDDAEINRVLMSHYFKGFPVKLDFAPSASLACEKCSLHQFDLVVIDFDSKGESVARELRTNGVHSLLIALSPNSFSELEKETAIAAGFDQYLSRGIPKEELIFALREKLWKSS